MSDQHRINDEEAARAALKAYREARGCEDEDYVDILELCVALPGLMPTLYTETFQEELNLRLQEVYL